MKLWKQGFAMALAAAMLLAALTACSPSGPSTPEQPGSSSSSGTEQPGKDPGTGKPGKEPEEKPGETGKDPEEKPGTEQPGKDDTKDEDNKKTEEQKAIEATVDALNTVRAEYGSQPLTLNAEACAYAKEMAQVQLDGLTGKYKELGSGSEYSKKCTTIRGKKVQNKASVGFGAIYNGYPIEKTYRKWANSTNETSAERNKALVWSKETTFVGVGVVQNPDKNSEYKYMVVVMTY